MRLIFIPGFGETSRIFDRIAPDLPGEKVFIDNRDVLGSSPMPAINALHYARMLVEQYRITRADIIIGHSMGGWIAYAVKHLTGCVIVQIASWTDPNKVVRPLKNPDYIYWLVRKGWYFNSFNKRLFLQLVYRNQPSAQIFGEVFQQLIDSHPDYIINQLRIIFNSLESEIQAQPDLRIHSKKDSIVRFPDQAVNEVPGDHFNLFTHPQEVSTLVLSLLR